MFFSVWIDNHQILKILRDAQTQETLLVLALVFAVSDGAVPDQRSTYNIYKVRHVRFMSIDFDMSAILPEAILKSAKVLWSA